MDRSDIVTLYADTITYNDYGVAVKQRTSKDVYARVDSVTRAEFYDGGRNGLNPEYRMTMFFGDYNGESLIGYKGRMYSVYRTYQAKTDIIEVYVERRTGTNKAEPAPTPDPTPDPTPGDDLNGSS